MAKVKVCGQCGLSFTNGWSGAKYCSAACKQKAYRQRKATVTKKVNRACVRCQKSSGKSMYCSSTCKAMTNREKQGATVRSIKAMNGMDFGSVWMKCNENWKQAYDFLMQSGYLYLAHEKRWIKFLDRLPLPFLEEVK